MPMHANQLRAMAERVAQKIPIRVGVVAILIDRRNGGVVAVGHNKLIRSRGCLGRHSVHAEIDALRKVRKPSRNLVMYLYRRGGKAIDPCRGCLNVLRAYGVPWRALDRKV